MYVHFIHRIKAKVILTTITSTQPLTKSNKLPVNEPFCICHLILQLQINVTAKLKF